MSRKQIAAVIIRKGDMILMHRANYAPKKGKIDLVGGMIEDGESPEQAAVREASEETCLDITLKKKLFVYDYFDREDKTMHIFEADIISGQLKGSAEGEPVWVDINNIPLEEIAFPHTLRILKCIQNDSDQ